MSMDYIRSYYAVPARKGARVEYTGDKEPMQGTITGAQGARLLIKLDGQEHSLPYHPSWKLNYLDGGAS